MVRFNRITCIPTILNGQPTIRGMRLSVRRVIARRDFRQPGSKARVGGNPSECELMSFLFQGDERRERFLHNPSLRTVESLSESIQFLREIGWTMR